MPLRARSASSPLSHASELISPQDAVQAPCVVVAVNERLASGLLSLTRQCVRASYVIESHVTLRPIHLLRLHLRPSTPAADARPARFDRPAREALYDAAVAG